MGRGSRRPSAAEIIGRPLGSYSRAAGSVDGQWAGSAEYDRRGSCRVVSVGYRRAPEAAYPAGLRDCYGVIRWVTDNRADLNGDGATLALAGDSSGGGMVASVTATAHDDGFRGGLAGTGDRRPVAAEKDRIQVAVPATPRQALTRAGTDGAEYAAPEGFYQAHLTVTGKVEILRWSTAPFDEPTELIGTGATHLFAEIDQDDTNFIMRMWDEAPGGARQLITSGYLKASHRELDEQTTEGTPTTRTVPVEPRTIEEYVLRLYPFAATFLPGHRLTVELSNDEPLADAHNALLPPDAFHLPVGRPAPTKSIAMPPTVPGWCCCSRHAPRWGTSRRPRLHPELGRGARPAGGHRQRTPSASRIIGRAVAIACPQ
ncbi:alpha/beta hydrolase fold domain-containing protein [Nocardia sp. X0981]